MNKTFPAHTAQSAPAEAREALSRAEQALGFIPNMYAKQAEAPALLEAYQTMAGIFESTSLDPTERVIVLMTASRVNDCDFCMSAHSWIARQGGIDENVVLALRSGEPLTDPRHEQLARFVTSLILERGRVSEAARTEFLEAGFTPRQALEVIVGVAAKVLTNFTNGVARTIPDPQFGKENLWPD